MRVNKNNVRRLLKKANGARLLNDGGRRRRRRGGFRGKVLTLLYASDMSSEGSGPIKRLLV